MQMYVYQFVAAFLLQQKLALRCGETTPQKYMKN